MGRAAVAPQCGTRRSGTRRSATVGHAVVGHAVVGSLWDARCRLVPLSAASASAVHADSAGPSVVCCVRDAAHALGYGIFALSLRYLEIARAIFVLSVDSAI